MSRTADLWNEGESFDMEHCERVVVRGICFPGITD